MKRMQPSGAQPSALGMIQQWQAGIPRELGLIGRVYLIMDQDEAVCGYVWPATRRRGAALGVFALELFPM